jgi:DNA replication and repair protein RecF
VDADLQAELVRGRGVDVNLGYTRLGPGRADFSLLADQAAIGPSRGQAKAMVILLQLAANAVDKARGGEGSVWLVDDLDADLDASARGLLLGLLLETGDQIFQTRVGASVAEDALDRSWSGTRFHVKQGVIAPV